MIDHAVRRGHGDQQAGMGLQSWVVVGGAKYGIMGT